MADLNVTVAAGLAVADPGPLAAMIATGVGAAARALRLAGPVPLTVSVTSGEVEPGTYQVTAGDVTVTEHATTPSNEATAAEIADLITWTICTQRSVLCAATGTTEPGAVRLAGLGAALPAAPLPPGHSDRASGPDRVSEEVLAERTTPVLSVAVAADLAAVVDAELPARLDTLREGILHWIGVPVPMIQVAVAADLAPGRIRVQVLDTPFEGSVPTPDIKGGGTQAGGTQAGGTADAILEKIRVAVLGNLASLLTKRGVDLLLGGLARTDPWLVRVLDAKYDRIDVTGILRAVLAGGLAVTGLRTIAERLVTVTGPVDAAVAANTVSAMVCSLYPAEFGEQSAYQAIAGIVSPSAWQYSGYAGLVWTAED